MTAPAETGEAMGTAVRVARKQLDIGVPELVRGVRACVRSRPRPEVLAALAASWDPPRAVVACLSARSGLDLLLAEVGWPPGSEVLLSAITIPHLATLVRAHGFVPVPVDVDPDTLQLDPADVRAAYTPRTRGLVFAQLLGAVTPVADLAGLAHERGLLVVEDRAESYDARDRALGEHADVSLHSFGTIKTSTCLGGGVLLVRDPALHARMLARQERWPVQTTGAYATKLLRGALMLAIGRPAVYPHFVRAADLVAGDHDVVVRRLSRGFGDESLLRQLRHRPSTALLARMAHRFATDDPAGVAARGRAGDLLAAALDPSVVRLGAQARPTSHWLFPVVSRNPDGLVAAGRAAGFDLTRGSSTLVALSGPGSRAHTAMRDVVYLPAHTSMTGAELRRLAAVVNAAEGVPARAAPGRPPRDRRRSLGSAPRRKQSR